MDNVKFVACCRDSRLIGRKFTTTAADLCFHKGEEKKGERRISYVEFRWACDQIASASGRTYEEVTEMMSPRRTVEQRHARRVHQVLRR